ncbi:hypothetical protein Pogu_0590 [Pyrobaculum oguniense TE7]|uniref:Uncharacterized protein n=1 Tax=Pyrobaculum oguniense (strain DSM 13380 / JCM 10595 / TE7) TaxID=698757 RepID=H6Q7W0_PYROT|nr:hypothetical protein Pogu_0590 [Pyrobaculum oguniense TE7]
MEKQIQINKENCAKLRAYYEVVDGFGEWLVLDALVGHLVGGLGGAVELLYRDEEGAVFGVYGLPCEIVLDMARSYLETLRSEVRVYAEDSLVKPPTRLKLRCEGCHE